MAIRNYNEVVFALLVATGLLALLLAFVWGLMQLFQRRQAQFRAEAERQRERQAHELAQVRTETQEATLAQIGQELHDHVGQSVALLRLQLGLLDPAPLPLVQQQRVADINNLVEQLLTDIRALAHSLDAAVALQRPLPDLLADQLRRIERTGYHQTALHVTGEPYALGPDLSLILLRVAQESLQNALKHSRATLLAIHLHYAPGEAQLSIQDNGVGFDPATTPTAGGAGLANIRRRAALMGGRSAIQSQPGNGTQVTIWLPNPEKTGLVLHESN